TWPVTPTTTFGSSTPTPTTPTSCTESPPATTPQHPATPSTTHNACRVHLLSSTAPPETTSDHTTKETPRERLAPQPRRTRTYDPSAPGHPLGRPQRQ